MKQNQSLDTDMPSRVSRNSSSRKPTKPTIPSKEISAKHISNKQVSAQSKGRGRPRKLENSNSKLKEDLVDTFLVPENPKQFGDEFFDDKASQSPGMKDNSIGFNMDTNMTLNQTSNQNLFMV